MVKLLFVLFILPSVALAQYDSVKRPDAIRFADGVFHTLSSPVRWKATDWTKFGVIMGGTAVLSFADKPTRSFWNNQEGKALDRVNSLGYHYGKPYCAFIFSAGFYTTGLLVKDNWTRETGLALATALLAAGFLQTALKPLVGRARPGNELGNYSVDFFNEEAAYHSFPSGHSSMAFTISFVLAKRSESIPVKIFFYSLAGSTAVCRLYSDAHWISDVAFGGIIAWFCSEAAIDRLNSNRYRTPNRKMKWNLSPYPGGITLIGKFK